MKRGDSSEVMGNSRDAVELRGPVTH